MTALDPVIDINGELIPAPDDVQELPAYADHALGSAMPRDTVFAARDPEHEKLGLLAAGVRLGAKQGRDVSSYDSGVNYRAYDFVISKRTEGTRFVSPGGAARKAAIVGAGRVYSEYHYAQPGDGAAQADFFLAVAGMPADNHLPVWLDYEVPGLSAAYRDAFCNRYKQRVGVAPGLYTYLAMWRAQLGRKLGAARRLWLAHYGVSTPGDPCDIWQWRGGPDLNTAYTALQAMTVGANRTLPPVLSGHFSVDEHTYPYGPNWHDPYSTTGLRPASSTTYRTRSGDTWSGILRAKFSGTINGKITTNEAALKQWHKTHGGELAYAGYRTFGVGAVIVLPASSPGLL